MIDSSMWVIHYTDESNLLNIKKTGTLKSALCLMNPDEIKEHATKKREVCLPENTEWECKEGNWKAFFDD